IEEINLLYVAITRAKNQLVIERDLLPIGIKPTKHIQVRKPSQKITDLIYSKADAKPSDEKSYSFEEARKKYSNAYTPWSDKLDEELTKMFCEGYTVQQMKDHFGRSYGAIRSRIEKLELN